ncbi:hypothetical protein ACLOJK_035746 [Asimina triloba]
MNFVRRKLKPGRENKAPPNPNVPLEAPISPSLAKKPTPQTANLQKVGPESDGHNHVSSLPAMEDPSVKIVARIRPINDRERRGDRIVRKISSNSLSVEDRIFTFDSVVDSDATQEDVFQLVGVPLVKNSLAGFNTSILSYGQTGSGKTHTMWGPPSAMVEGSYSPRTNQGIVPRIFRMLFSEIQKEQENLDEKQVNYQCRCSFLEIYKEQITDLLDPTQRNLQIRDDPKNGFYVDNLTEEYVNSFEDVTQILIKETSSKCFSSSKSSRISLVDLAGSERNKLDDAGRECVKDAKNVKWSLSQLGHLIKTLAEVGQSGKPQNIPYESSCLTHLLRESLGGNAKLTVICAISPDKRSKGETLSTLRFGQRAKSIQNKAIVNEITEDYVNDLSDQIRQLKEELTRVKSSSDGGLVRNNDGYFKCYNARESLNQLRLSLNRSLILPQIDSDSDEELNIDEEDVRDLRVQIDAHVSFEDSLYDLSENMSTEFSSCEENSDTETAGGVDVVVNGPKRRVTEAEISPIASMENVEASQTSLRSLEELPQESIRTSPAGGVDVVVNETKCRVTESEISPIASVENVDASQTSLRSLEELPQESISTSPSTVRASLSIMPSRECPVFLGPTMSDSPKIDNKQRKSVSFASSKLSESQHCLPESPKINSDALRQSVKRSDPIRSSLQSSKTLSNPTESLAASLHRGLQIIDYHQRNLASTTSFSFDKLILKQSQSVEKVDAAGMQTLTEEGKSSVNSSVSFLCASCKQKNINDSKQVPDSLDTCIVPFDGAAAGGRLEHLTLRERELEKTCAEQKAQIKQLNQLVEQYKLECQGQGTKILQLDGQTDENMSLEDEHKTLRLDYESHTEVSRKLTPDSKASLDIDEKEAFLKEIQSLKDQLSQLKQHGNAVMGSVSLDKTEKELENESQKWTEMESGWISITEELRIDLESKRQLAEKTEIELRQEKVCSAELDDALQRAVLGHARIVEHYAELQEKYNGLFEKHRKIMVGIEEVKRAAAKAKGKGAGSRFVNSLAAELSSLRVERDRERDHLKKENKSLKVQLRDTAEAVHAAGELLVRLKEAEAAASATEEKCLQAQQETEKVKKQMEKLKKKHKMEIVTMKHYLAESRLPESALKSTLQQDLDHVDQADDQEDWRAEFGPLYRQDSYNNSIGYNSNVRSFVDLYRDK